MIRTFGETIKSAYALTLIGMEEKKGHITPLVNNFSKNAIEERILSIMKIKRSSLVGIILALALVIGTTTVFATNATNTTDAKPEETNPASAPIGTVVTTPTALPQNDTAESRANDSMAEPTDNTTNEDTISQTPVPENANANNGAENNVQDGYPMDQNGWWTYGNASMRKALGLDYDADLMEAIGTEGQSGYIRTKDRESNTPSALDEYSTIPLFDVNGYVRGAFVLSHSVAMENGVYISAAQEPSYPRNSKGETYGSNLMAQALGCEPDLVAALGTEGQDGYIRESDQPWSNVSTREEAAEYMEWLKTQPSTILIPLYDQEGNVIGEYGISNSSSGGDDKHYDSLEEAREAVENGG